MIFHSYVSSPEGKHLHYFRKYTWWTSWKWWCSSFGGDHGDHVLVFKKDNNPKTGGWTESRWTHFAAAMLPHSLLVVRGFKRWCVKMIRMQQPQPNLVQPCLLIFLSGLMVRNFKILWISESIQDLKSRCFNQRDFTPYHCVNLRGLQGGYQWVCWVFKASIDKITQNHWPSGND